MVINGRTLMSVRRSITSVIAIGCLQGDKNVCQAWLGLTGYLLCQTPGYFFCLRSRARCAVFDAKSGVHSATAFGVLNKSL
jgi:hypothetical protein